MNGVTKGAFIFLLGGAIGSLVTYGVMKEKLDKTIKNEIDQIKEYFFEKTQAEGDVENDISKPENLYEKPSIVDYVSLLERTKYRQFTEEEISIENAKEETMTVSMEPYVIAPDVFGDKEDDGYDLITLYYYNDKVLTDDNNEEVGSDTLASIGVESLNTFGEYEDDSVYVRNNRLKVDYEILLVDELYSERVPMKERLSKARGLVGDVD